MKQSSSSFRINTSDGHLLFIWLLSKSMFAETGSNPKHASLLAPLSEINK